MKIVILDSDTISNGDIDLTCFCNLGNITCYGYTKKEDVAKRIGDADAIFCTKSEITAEVFKLCPNLKYVGLFSTGFNNVDLDAATHNGVTVTNVPEYSTHAVAQHVFALILRHFSKVSEYNSSVENGDWIKSTLFTYYNIPIIELSELTIGIIGFGNIGRKVAEIANAFGMKVLVYTKTIPEGFNNVTFVSQKKLFENSDIITIHCPLNDETKELICMDTISLMKKTAMLINTARGGIVNEKDLAFALNNNLIAAAGLDVLSVEPMLESNPLRIAKNCYITPHVAWSPKSTRERLIKMAIENFISWNEKSPKNVVN